MPDQPPTSRNERITGGWLTDPATQSVFKTLNQDGYEARAVGGTLRNALAGLEPADIDFATTAPPNEVERLATAAGLAVHPTGIDHGTVTLVCKHKPFEVTTLRKDVSTDGRRASVAFTTDWREDALRRDFTVNALYCDARGEILDPLNGLPDIHARRIRFIDDPHARIREDYLRILRFFRFYSTFGHGEIDAAGLAACRDLKDGIKTLSGERLHAEFIKLVVGSSAFTSLKNMHETGVLTIALGTIPDLDAFKNLIALEGTLQRPPDAVLRMAALAVTGEASVSTLRAHLKLSNSERQRLAKPTNFLSAHGANPFPDMSAQEKMRALYHLGTATYRDTCLLAWAKSRLPASDKKMKSAFQFAQNHKPPEMPFTGADVLALAVAPGPVVGRILSHFETWWIERGFPSAKPDLENKLAELANQATTTGPATPAGDEHK